MKKIKIPYNYLPYEFNKNNSKKIFKRWNALIKSSQFTLGPFLEEFEKKFAKYIGAKYCIATNNGTDALILALKALNIKKNDEIITVTNTFYATVGAIVNVGAKPVLVDCDDKYQIDISKIEDAITRKTKAIIPGHWGGASPDMFKRMKIAKKHNIQVVEDACMGIGGKIRNKSPGTFGKVNAFSMHPLKSLNVMGDGGAVVTNNYKIYKWMLKFRNHGMINRDNIDFWGVNIRMQPLQCIVAIEGLKKIDDIIIKRNKNALFIDKELTPLYPKIILPKRVRGYKETFALYMILCEDRDKLKKYLDKNGIETKIHYPKPLHLQKAYKINNKVTNLKLKVSEDQADNLLTLPIHQYLNKKQLNYMASKIKEFYNTNQ